MKKVILLTDKTKESGKAVATVMKSGYQLEILDAYSLTGVALVEAGYPVPSAFTDEGICRGLEEVEILIGKECNDPC